LRKTSHACMRRDADKAGCRARGRWALCARSAGRGLGFETTAGPARLVGVHGRDDRALAQHAPNRLRSARQPRGRHGAPQQPRIARAQRLAGSRAQAARRSVGFAGQPGVARVLARGLQYPCCWIGCSGCSGAARIARRISARVLKLQPARARSSGRSRAAAGAPARTRGAATGVCGLGRRPACPIGWPIAARLARHAAHRGTTGLAFLAVVVAAGGRRPALVAAGRMQPPARPHPPASGMTGEACAGTHARPHLPPTRTHGAGSLMSRQLAPSGLAPAIGAGLTRSPA